MKSILSILLSILSILSLCQSLMLPKISYNINKIISTLSISLSIIAPSSIIVPSSSLAADVRLADKLQELQQIQKTLDEADQKFEVTFISLSSP